ncbi:MAG TPA: hypothetical protein VEX86_00895 [Longimicrobium sp.]|nr:hypothetical protein [Longimicrobium sp.]
MGRIAVVLLVFFAAGCAAFRRDTPSGSQTTRLCVRNETVGYGNIVAYADIVRFNVMPGQEVCRPVPAAGAQLALRASTSGGGSTGPLTYSAMMQTGTGGCWRWRLTDSRSSSIDLTPC